MPSADLSDADAASDPAPTLDAGANEPSPEADVSLASDSSDGARGSESSSEEVGNPADTNGYDARYDVDGLGWSPLALPHLSLWLDAQGGIVSTQSNVSAWNDRSPNELVAAQDSQSARPTVISAGIGDYPGVSFDHGQHLIILDHAALNFGYDDFAMTFVLRHKTPVNQSACGAPYYYGTIYAKIDDRHFPYTGPAIFANVGDVGLSAPGFIAQLDFGRSIRTPNNSAVAYNDDRPRVVGMYRHGSALTIRVNGRAMGTVDLPNTDGGLVNVDANKYDAYIGSRPLGQCFVGVIAEIIAVAPVTEQEVLLVEKYLFEKHAAALIQAAP
jgi:hypothetical protein